MTTLGSTSLTGSRLKSLADGLKQASSKLPPTSLAIALIDRNPEQPRQHFDEQKLSQLADSIKARGVIQPIRVRPFGSGRYQIVVGERRWRAAQLAGLTEIPVVVEEMTDTDALAAGLIENIDREDMIPADEVVAVARLAKETTVQIAAAALGKTATWVSKRKRIAEAPAFVGEFLKSQATADIEALYELAKLADDDVALAREIASTFKPGEHLRDRLRTAAKEIKAPPPANETEPAGAAHPAARGAELDDHDDDSEGSASASSSTAGTREPSVSHAKERPEGNGSDTEGRAAGSRAPRAQALVVESVRKKGKLLVLVTASGDEVSCDLSDEAREQLVRILAS